MHVHLHSRQRVRSQASTCGAAPNQCCSKCLHTIHSCRQGTVRSVGRMPQQQRVLSPDSISSAPSNLRGPGVCTRCYTVDCRPRALPSIRSPLPWPSNHHKSVQQRASMTEPANASQSSPRAAALITSRSPSTALVVKMRAVLACTVLAVALTAVAAAPKYKRCVFLHGTGVTTTEPASNSFKSYWYAAVLYTVHM